MRGNVIYSLDAIFFLAECLDCYSLWFCLCCSLKMRTILWKS